MFERGDSDVDVDSDRNPSGFWKPATRVCCELKERSELEIAKKRAPLPFGRPRLRGGPSEPRPLRSVT